MMSMKKYVGEVEYSTRSLFEILWKEQITLESLQKEIDTLIRQVEHGYRQAEFISEMADNPEDVAWATGTHWDTYFGPDKDLYHKKEDEDQLREKILAHNFSMGTLAGSILQVARQGISICHGGLADCPNGKGVGQQFLENVIWQGRNQAMHWDEGGFHTPVKRCFEFLTNDFGAKFNEYKDRNMALDVVALLGWTEYSVFQSDMLSIA